MIRWVGGEIYTSANISSMSFGEIVTPSFLIKRKPWVEAASRTSLATAGEGLEMSITGISDFTIVASGSIYVRSETEWSMWMV